MTATVMVEVRILPFTEESESVFPCAGAGAAVGVRLWTEAVGELEVLEEPDESAGPAESAGVAGVAEPQLPEYVFPFFVPTVVTSGPGLGKNTSVSSAVVQPLPILALKISGRCAKGMAGSGPLPEAMVTEAQFMYISRLPGNLSIGCFVGTVTLIHTRMVPPKPCKYRSAGLSIRGNVELEAASSGSWAGALIRVDDLPCLSFIIAKCCLARSAIMKGWVGRRFYCSCDSEVVFRSGIPGHDARAGRGPKIRQVGSAREVAPIGAGDR